MKILAKDKSEAVVMLVLAQGQPEKIKTFHASKEFFSFPAACRMAIQRGIFPFFYEETDSQYLIIGREVEPCSR